MGFLVNGVLLVDHILDKPRDDFRLMRLCEWAGCRLQDFGRLTLEPDHDPGWITQVGTAATRVVVTLGAHATAAAGLPGAIFDTRGYFAQGFIPGAHLLPTVDPGLIQSGGARWSAAFINDMQKALQVAQTGMPPQSTAYVLDPLPQEAQAWAVAYREALAAEGDLPLAFDIETPGKGDDEEAADTDGDAPDRTWHIERISFAYRPLGALSIPWAGPYQAAIALCLGSAGSKVVWNEGFDVPRIRRTGQEIRGLIHDGMVAWHILHSDQPKKLGHVATFTCPFQPRWKHLSGALPAYYNATDSDVELRSWLRIREELARTGLWAVYQRDVIDLNPVLQYMHTVGMPVSAEVRLDRAQRLAVKARDVKAQLEAAVPQAARRISHVYKTTPKDLTGLQARPGVRQMPHCTACGLAKPRKDHFKVTKKRVNPCAGAGAVSRQVPVTEHYRLADFSPSRDQLVRYHEVLKRALPTVWDKRAGRRRVSFGERQVLDLVGKYPLDPLYPLVLQWRSIDKIAGTYIGRPV